MKDQSGDPADIWRTMFSEMERNFNSLANQVMGTPEFSRVTDQAETASLGLQKMFGGALERYLTGMNLPSRSEIASLGERLLAIEAQLSGIKTLLREGRRGDNVAGVAVVSKTAVKRRRAKRPRSVNK